MIVTTNMFGDILSDEASEFSGSLGIGGSLNEGDAMAVAQAHHGSASDIQGQDNANPVSLVLSAAMILNWRGRKDGNETLLRIAALIGDGVEEAFADRSQRGAPPRRPRRAPPKTHRSQRAADGGGMLGTRTFTDRLCAIVPAKSRQFRSA